MTLAIDKAGRVVLPKPVRDRLGIHPGAELDMHVEADGEIRLRVKKARPALERIDGVLVHGGKAAPDLDWDAFVDRERDDRLRSLSGGI